MSSYLVVYRHPFYIVLFAFLLLLAFARPIMAAEIRGDETITTGKYEVIDELLVSSNIDIVDWSKQR